MHNWGFRVTLISLLCLFSHALAPGGYARARSGGAQGEPEGYRIAVDRAIEEFGLGNFTQRNYCATSPCQHGTCSSGATGYTCNCSGTDYTGTNCQTRVNDCLSASCLNGGTCIDGDRTYTCRCPIGFGGSRCETNHCATLNCAAGFTCVGWDPSVYPFAVARCRPNCYPNCATGQSCYHDDDCASRNCGTLTCI